MYFQGLSWLLQTMNEDFQSLKERVERDVVIQVRPRIYGNLAP